MAARKAQGIRIGVGEGVRGRTRARNLLASIACSAYNRCMQYTLRNVQALVDAALRPRAAAEDKSLHDVAIEALARGVEVNLERRPRRDLRDVAGTWRKDRAFDRALAAQDTVDEELWK